MTIGSDNDTSAALRDGKNAEKGNIHCSWQDSFHEYASEELIEFDALWNGSDNEAIISSMPPAVEERFKQIVGTKSYKTSLQRIHEIVNDPYPPLRPYQRDAINEWLSKEKSPAGTGIFRMATGSGKTLTAIHLARHVARQRLDKGANYFVIVVACPYTVLADQWSSELRKLGHSPVRVYDSLSRWKPELMRSLSAAINSSEGASYEERVVYAVCVNKTFKSDDLQNVLADLNPSNSIIIADECHRHRSPSYQDMAFKPRFRLGLSATPWQATDTEGEQLLTNLYGQPVYDYPIERAMAEGRLCQYKYVPIVVSLSAAEEEEYGVLTAKVAGIEAKKSKTLADREILNSLYGRRARLLASTSEKFEALAELVNNRKTPVNKALFYCGDGSSSSQYTGDEEVRDTQHVQKILERFHYRSAKFTAQESSTERRNILSNFDANLVSALVAIRVLDEGVDLPDCREAYLLASSRNERQFVQRRGRILRKAAGKTSATLTDFIVLPRNKNMNGAKALAESELWRANEFIRSAANKEALEDWLKSRAAEHELTVEEIQTRVERLIALKDEMELDTYDV